VRKAVRQDVAAAMRFPSEHPGSIAGGVSEVELTSLRRCGTVAPPKAEAP
jgi:hypothetical protein